MIGQTLSHFKITAKLGEGGMGVVYRAEDLELKRDVAIKVLPADVASDPSRSARFRREAEAVAALNHPNIVTIHAIEEAQALESDRRILFLTMELIEGHTLGARIPEGGLALEEFFELADQIAAALAEAHARGIVHRDLKPGNIMIAGENRLKVLDFGLAKMLEDQGVAPEAATLTEWRTEAPAFMGTPGYTSPEQVERQPADPRSDVFSAGCVLYRMLAGHGPFEADTAEGSMSALLRGEWQAIGEVRPETPKKLRPIIERCLARNPADRYANGAELLDALRASRASILERQVDRGRPLRSPRTAALVGIPLLLLLSLAAWWGVRTSRKTRVHSELLPRAESMLAEQRFAEAFVAARRAERILPGDPRARSLMETASLPIDTDVHPAGAEVFVRGYSDLDTEWIQLGKAPLGTIRVPAGELRWRVTLEGHAPAEGSLTSWIDSLSVQLVPSAEALPGMVRVPDGVLSGATPVEVPAYWLDRYEVTNAEYRRFVAQGGYTDSSLWTEPFVLDDRQLSWDEAIRLLRDATGRPGPAKWTLGTYPKDEDDLPVSGISWYEGAAYCASVGKRLPTIFHWLRAASIVAYGDILVLSNFDGTKPVAVGSRPGVGPFGTYDMAGNVEEWTATALGGQRYMLGGAFGQPEYLFQHESIRHPFEREETFGVRCMRTDGELPEALLGEYEERSGDFRGAQPVGDESYALLASHYRYDHAPIKGEVVSRDESGTHWIHETVRYPAAYGDQEVVANVYLPLSSRPPYQAVIYVPGSAALRLTSSRYVAEFALMEFLPRSGRALIYPVYDRTYERGGGERVRGNVAWRDLLVHWSKDIGRTIDYLETRDDIDSERLALLGLSLGGIYGPNFAAVEDRLGALILLGGGLWAGVEKALPETNPVNFAPHVSAPTLMIAGRWDNVRDLEREQRPLFDLIGMPEADKRLAVLDGGHVPPWNEVIRESLEWLDRHLGPVSP